MKIRDLVREARKEEGMNQTEFGAKFGFESRYGVGKWESGDSRVPNEVLEYILNDRAMWLVEWLFEEAREKTKNNVDESPT